MSKSVPNAMLSRYAKIFCLDMTCLTIVSHIQAKDFCFTP